MLPLSILIPYALFLLLLVLLMLGLTLFLATNAMSVFGHAPFVPSSIKVVRKILAFADVKKGDTIYDLGCGDGRVVTFAASELGSRGVGVERNPLLALLARLRVKSSNLGNLVKIEGGNFLKTDLSGADVVFLYLMPSANKKLEQKLQNELKEGARVVSRHFTFPNWKPVKVDEEEKLYLYVVS